MTWEASLTGKRDRQPNCSGEKVQKTVRGTVFKTNAIQTCFSMKVLFGRALRQVCPRKGKDRLSPDLCNKAVFDA